jgi:hypothetical protein
MNNKGVILIIFAWAMEIVGITGGMINSIYTTFGEHLPDSLPGYLPAVPMLALAVAESGRVPLASVLYHKHKLAQALAIIGMAVLGYLAVENWTFGFERIVDLRLKTVNTATRELAAAKDHLAALLQQRQQTTTSNTEKREELRRGIAQRETNLSGLTAQLATEAETHQQKLAQIREACRIVRERCMVPQLQGEDNRYAEEVSRLNADLGRQRQERSQSELDKLVARDASEIAALDQKISAATTAVNEADQTLRIAADGNQIYRLAASWYRVSTSNVTQEQFATARLVFATFSAIAVALAGSMAALVYYARNRVPTDRSLMVKVANAIRAYYGRKRKPIVREVPGPERVIYRDGKEPAVVVEKEVIRVIDRVIDRIVLIPRFGIRFPVYVNWPFRRGERINRPNGDGLVSQVPDQMEDPAAPHEGEAADDQAGDMAMNAASTNVRKAQMADNSNSRLFQLKTGMSLGKKVN